MPRAADDAPSAPPAPSASGPSQSSGTGTSASARDPERLAPGAPQPERVEAEERPCLGAQQRGRERERQRRAVTAREARDDGPQRRRGEQSLRVAQRRVQQPPVRQRHRRDRRDRCDRPRQPRRRAPPPPRGRAARRPARRPATAPAPRRRAARAPSSRRPAAASTTDRPRCRVRAASPRGPRRATTTGRTRVPTGAAASGPRARCMRRRGGRAAPPVHAMWETIRRKATSSTATSSIASTRRPHSSTGL